MKRTAYTLLAALAAFASLWACQDRLVPEVGDTVEKDCIVLRLGSSPLSVETRSGSERGVNYNENLIESVDLFFYPDGATDQNAVLSALGRGVEARAETDSTVYYVSVHYTASQAGALFGSTTGGTCQVYAIANANLSYGGDTSLDALKHMLIERDFTMAEVQNSFVMSSDGTATVTQALDGSGDPYATGRVRMKRAAAKAQLFLRFPESLPDDSDNNRTWKPDLDGTHHSSGVTVRLTNISRKGRIDADYAVQEADYTDYEGWGAVPRSTSLPAFYPAIDAGYDDYNYATAPFYTYPISWSDIDERECAYIITVPWYPVDYDPATDTSTEGTHSESRKYQVSANVIGLEMKRNYCYRTFVYIQSLGGVSAEQTEVIPECDYYICPWILETGSGAGDGTVFGSFSAYKYLVIDQPEVVLNNAETATFTYISSSNVSSVTITKIVYYDNTQATPKQELTSGTAFNTAKGKITINYSNSGVVTMTHSLSDALGRYGRWEVWATVTNTDGITGSVHFVQNPSIRLERSANAGNVFVNGFFARVKNATFGSTYYPYVSSSYSNWDGYYNFVSDTQQYYHSNTNWNSPTERQFSQGYQRQVNDGYIASIQSGSYGTVMGDVHRLDASIDRNFFTTIINVSSFTSGNNTYHVGSSDIEYAIGDPRVKASDVYSGSTAWTTVTNFYKYLTSDTPTAAEWSSPGNILISSQSSDMQNVIAPKFLVSSALNANQGLTFETAVKRAATYQEAGYPAGRWRLPTEAEMAFIVARQNDGTIPTLYATDSPYWSGSGRLLTPSTGGSISFSDDDGSTHSVRFVYDLWYWGDTASTTNVYHPNGHKYNYDASGTATLR